MKRRVKVILANIKRFNNNTTKYLQGRCLYAWICEIYCAVRFGCSPEDFFRYRFYEKSNYERNKFITHRRCQRIIKKYNDKNKNHIFQNKVTFNEHFKDFIGREWLCLQNASQTEFEDFIKKHKQVIMKPINGGQGKGIFKLSYDETKNVEYVDDYRNYIVEELLIQHEEMSKINSSSVNTVRVLTFKGQIIACALRTGSAGAVVDNLRSSGVCAHVDVDTGIIDTKCMDKDFNTYISHPDSKVVMVGIQLPEWEKMKEFIHNAVKIVPEVEYVGWDVAILKDGFALIEGNHDPGHSVVQMIAQTGLYQTIRRIKNSK